MQACARSCLALLALLPLACEGPDTQDDPQADSCPPAVDGVPASYTVSVVGFPEIENDALVDPDGTLDFTGSCTVTQLSFVVDELTMALACEHPSSTDASVAITSAATGLPAGLSLDDSVELASFAYLNQGGDHSGGVFRALTNVNIERHVISDEEGVVFASLRGGLEASFGSITVEEQFNCPGWMPCSADGDISGYIRASSGDGQVDVQIAEVGQLEDGALAWDVSLFQARLGGCHGNDGGFSILRQP